MKFLLVFARSDPWRSLFILLCLVLAGSAEGVGLATLLPFRGPSAQAAAAAAQERALHLQLSAAAAARTPRAAYVPR